VQTIRIRYGDHASQWIDLSLPDSVDGRLPVVIFIHGGYWRDVHGADQGEPLVADLVAAGVAAVNVEYRRVGRSSVHGGGGWPATFLDIAAAIDSLDGRDELDLDRVVAVGHSAGGQLAAWAAARTGLPADAPGADPRVRLSAYVSLAGVLDLISGARERLDNGAVQNFLGGEPDQRPEAYALSSPINRLPIGIPGVCLHGTKDDRVPYEQTRTFVAAATRAGDDCRSFTLVGTGHFEYRDPSSAAWAAARSVTLALLEGQRQGT
jgi:acetyl esterase/lipase